MFCKKAIQRSTVLSGNSYCSREKFPDEKCSIHPNFQSVNFSPLLFLRFSEVGFSPFRDFPGLIIIRKKTKNRLLNFWLRKQVKRKEVSQKNVEFSVKD